MARSPDSLDVHVTTEGGAYDIRDVIYDGRAARVLYSSTTHTAQSGLARDGGAEELFDYNERFMEIIRGLEPRRILLIGGGAMVLPRAIIRAFPQIRLTVVEIDPDLPELGKQYFDFVPSAHTTIHIGDGYEFLQTDGSVYDLVLLDVFAEAAIPAAFRTPQTAALLHRRISSDGTVAMNIIAAQHGRYSVILRRQVAAFRAAFAAVQLFPAGRSESAWYPENFILTAQRQPHDLSPYLHYPPVPAIGTA